MWLALVAFVLLTAANAFFVATEYSLVTVDRPMVVKLASSGDRKAKQVLAALKALSFQLSGAQFGITVSALLTGYVAEPAIAQLIRPAVLLLPGGDGYARSVSVALALLLATLISMLFGELVPKNAALAKPTPIALWAARPHRIFSAVFSPIVKVLNGSANWVVRRLGFEPQEELASARSPEELGLLAAMSARAGALPAETATLLQRTIRFRDKRAAEAMTPRVDVVALDADATVADLLQVAQETGHTRFPAYVDNLDQVVGVVSVIDALAVPEGRRASSVVGSVAHEPILVPESLSLDDVLDALEEARVEMAVVVDEYGGTDGIITTEDLVEELVGEIDDEYDPPRANTEATRFTAPSADPARLVSGLLREDELFEQTGFRLPEGPYETLGGFLMAQLGRIPVEGESAEFNGWTFTVTAVDRHRVSQVAVRPPADWTPADEQLVADEGLGAPPAGTDHDPSDRFRSEYERGADNPAAPRSGHHIHSHTLGGQSGPQAHTASRDIHPDPDGHTPSAATPADPGRSAPPSGSAAEPDGHALPAGPTSEPLTSGGATPASDTPADNDRASVPAPQPSRHGSPFAATSAKLADTDPDPRVPRLPRSSANGSGAAADHRMTDHGEQR